MIFNYQITLLRKVLILLVLISVGAILFFSYPFPASATTPAGTKGVSKPENLVIYLPWASGVSALANGNGYGAEGSYHIGAQFFAIDFNLSPEGSDIYPVRPGNVIFAANWGDYGKTVIIRHDIGDAYFYYSQYAHLAEDSLAVTGDRYNPPYVELNQKLGNEGKTGYASGIHLHFSLRRCNRDIDIIWNGSTPSGLNNTGLCQSVVPEPFIGREVYEGFGLPERWPGPLEAATISADSVPGIPNTTIWDFPATGNGSTIEYGNKVLFSIRRIPADVKEIRFTTGYKYQDHGWSKIWTGENDALSDQVWRILARCKKDTYQSYCHWGSDPQYSNEYSLWFEWDPYADGLNVNGIALYSDAPWLPSGTAEVYPASVSDGQTTNNVCISFDVFDNAGNAAYAPDDTQCAGVLGPASSNGFVRQSASQENSSRLIYILPSSVPYPEDNWLLEFSKAEEPPLNVDVHIRVNWTTDFDAFRICFDGTNCQETSATELFYTWNTSGWSDGNHTLSVQYRRKSDGGNWLNALKHEEQFYLSPNRNGIASCDGGDGAYLRSGSDCIRVTADQRDLASIGWSGRHDLYVAIQGNYQAWVYDSVDYQGTTRVVNSGENKSVGGNVASIKLVAAPPAPPPLPTEPFSCDANTVAIYHMDEGSGNAVTDSCNGINGTKDGAITWTSGIFGGALNFVNGPDGVRAVNLGAPSALNLCPMSLEMWLKRGGEGRIASQLGGGGNTGSNKWLLSMYGNIPTLQIWSGDGVVQSYKGISDTNWHLLMFSFNCSNTAKLYLDNELVGTMTTPGPWASGNTTFEIGSGEGIYRYTGTIDEVRISNTVRAPQPPPGPTAAFAADNTDGVAPFGVQFIDNSSGTITSWNWDFGDGSHSTAQNPFHFYNASGDYTVSLTVTGPWGSDVEIQSSFIHVTVPPPPGIDILYNGDFEQGNAAGPFGWFQDAWQMPRSTFTWDTEQKHSGAKSVKITNNTTNDARWVQIVSIQPNSLYRLSGWIKTSDVPDNGGRGANLSYGTFQNTEPKLYGTNDWTYVSVEFNSGSNTTLYVEARLGMDSGDTLGTAWFDDIKLELLSEPVCYNLTTSSNPPGSGTVSVYPTPNCNFGTQYVHGTVVTLTAAPNAGYSFADWNDSTINNPSVFTMGAEKAVTANFSLIPPQAFNKTSPSTGATGQLVNTTLSWESSTYATSYEYCYDTTNDNACSDWLPNGMDTSKTLSGLSQNTIYYWHVRAINPGGITYANSSSTAFWSFKTMPPVASAGTYDDKANVWSYGGTWTNQSASSAYGGSYKYSTATGASATAYFSGIQVKLYYTVNSSMGNLAVYIDDVLVTTINQKSSRTVYKKTWLSPVYADGVHKVTFVRNSGKVNVDALQVIPAPDSIPPAIIADLSAAPGAAYGQVNLQWTAVGDDGNTGTAASYQVRYSTSIIDTDAKWTSAKPVTSGLPAPAIVGTTQSMTVSGLAPSLTYYFAIRAVDDGGNLGPLSNSPSAIALAPPPVPSGIYDNLNPNWIFGGTWTTATISGASGGNVATSTLVGSSAALVFNGSGFTLRYYTKYGNGSLTVYVDGVLRATISQKSTSTMIVWKTYVVSGLTPGAHVIQLVDSTGKVNFDNIVIAP